MIKTITLNNLPYTRFSDESPFYLTATDTLTLKFLSSKYDLSKGYLRLRNGKVTKTFSLKDLAVTLSPTTDNDILFVGKLEILIDLPDISKVWHIAPISIKEFNENDFVFKDLISEWEQKLQDLTARVERLENKQKNPFSKQ